MTGLLVFGLLAAALALWARGQRDRVHRVLGSQSTSRHPNPAGRASWAGSTVAPQGRLSTELSVPLSLDLMAAMIANGTTLVRSLECLASAAPEAQAQQLQRVCVALRLGVDWETAWSLGRRDAASSGRGKKVPSHAGLSVASQVDSASVTKANHSNELQRALALTALTGAGASAALRAQAAQVRRRTQREAQKRASRLGVRLVVPLGVCVLPAFIVLGVIPVIMSVIPQLW